MGIVATVLVSVGLEQRTCSVNVISFCFCSSFNLVKVDNDNHRFVLRFK